MEILCARKEPMYLFLQVLKVLKIREFFVRILECLMKMMSYFNVKIKLNPYESYDALFTFYAEVPGSGSARSQAAEWKV